jgi:hypothetical protein
MPNKNKANTPNSDQAKFIPHFYFIFIIIIIIIHCIIATTIASCTRRASTIAIYTVS